MRNCQPGAYYAGAGRRVAETDLRHISVSDHPTTDIRETCTYNMGRRIRGGDRRGKDGGEQRCRFCYSCLGLFFRTLFKTLDRGHLKLGQQVRSSNPTSQKVYRVTATMVEKKFRNFQDLPLPLHINTLHVSDL